MNLIGIMQGRLLPPESGKIQSFPKMGWESEFQLAQKSGLQCIEWIFDLHGLGSNPIESDEGINHMVLLGQKHDVSVHSLCADYFMDKRIFGLDQDQKAKNLETLKWLLGQCHKKGIKRIVLPFVDQSSLKQPQDKEEVLECLISLTAYLDKSDIEIHLETDLDPQGFKSFMDKIPHPKLKVNYDAGNSASLGYNPQNEFEAYGNRVGSVHIKDRKKGGFTFPLGQGDTDFNSLFDQLRKFHYAGDFILQVARGQNGQEVEWAQNNRDFVIKYWSPKPVWT